MFLKSFKSLNSGLFILAIFVFVSLLLLRDLVLINVRNLPFDDGLFVGRAESLIGNTERSLGSTRGFNPLVKGQVYPFILELSNFVNLNPLVVVYIFFWVAVIAIFILLYIHTKDIKLVLPFILFVIFDPSPFSAEASRISREFFYEVTILLVFAFFVKFKITFFKEKKYFSFPYIITAGISLGLVIFLANNTREERPWVYLILLSGFIWVIEKNKNKIRTTALVALIAIVAYSLLNFNLKNYNNDIFGVSLTSTTVEGEFPRLMSNLSSIQVTEKFNPYVSISEKKREIAYENSPSFSLLKEYLEGEGQAWIQFGCANSETCEDYANGWFHVALRVAIDDSELWITQSNAQNYMRKVNNELELACNSGKIKCVDALPLAKALGVTKITGEQIMGSLNYLGLYVNKSIFGWNRNSPEHGPYVPMDEKQWERWKFVIKSLPESQVEYQNMYNNRITIFNPIYTKWVSIYSLFNLVGLLSLLLILYRLIFRRSKISKSDLLMFSIATYSLFIWLTRGALLAINSTTNFISVSENYSLSGRVFLPIAFSIFSYLGVKFILDSRNEK